VCVSVALQIGYLVGTAFAAADRPVHSLWRSESDWNRRTG
jgi:hypothetical protein